MRTSKGVMRRVLKGQLPLEMLVDAELRTTITRFEKWLVDDRGLLPSTSGTYGRTLAALMRKLKIKDVVQIFDDAEGVIEYLNSTPFNRTRNRLFSVITHAVDHSESAEAAHELLDKITHAFPARQRKTFHLADMDLGGSKKGQRVPPVLSWSTGSRLISGAQMTGSRYRLRDIALVALHVRSSFAPAEILQLTWRDLMPFITNPDSTDDFLSLTVGSDPRVRVVHIEARGALAHYWRAVGRPRAGLVFMGRPGGPLGLNRANYVVRCAERAANLDACDRRLMRGPFAWVLVRDGWTEPRLRDALGYRHFRDLERLLEPYRERQAQAAAAERIVFANQGTLTPNVNRPIKRSLGTHISLSTTKV